MMGGKKIKIPLTCTTQAPDTSRETARLIIWLRSSEGRKKTYNFRQLSPISVRVMTVCGKRPCAASLPIHSNPYLAGEELLSVRVLLFNSFLNVPPPPTRLLQTGVQSQPSISSSFIAEYLPISRRPIYAPNLSGGL